MSRFARKIVGLVAALALVVAFAGCSCQRCKPCCDKPCCKKAAPADATK